MKRAFTLIELMIVTVVLVTLMAIVFRLAGITGPQEARAKTIKRMQCIENCLSGRGWTDGFLPQLGKRGGSLSLTACWREISFFLFRRCSGDGSHGG